MNNGSVEHFERFKHRLRSMPSDAVHKILTEQLQARCADLLTAYQDGETEQRVEALKRLSFTAMALHASEGGGNRMPFGRPAWTETAESGIRAFVAEAETVRYVLEDTVFFHGTRRTLIHLNDVVSGAVVPAGAYDNPAFAAGAALGAVRAEF